jgi:hypothetical protein
MQAVAWANLGVLAAAAFGMFAALFNVAGSINLRIDTLGSTLTARIDALDTSLNGRIDALDARLSARIDALSARLDNERPGDSQSRW